VKAIHRWKPAFFWRDLRQSAWLEKAWEDIAVWMLRECAMILILVLVLRQGVVVNGDLV